MDIGQILGNLGFDWRVAFANLVNFLVIIWILKRFAFKPIEQMIKEREDKIKKGIEDSERSSTELQMAQQTSDQTIMEARGQANKIIASAQKESEKIILDSRAAQESQAKHLVEEAKKVIQQEKHKMMQDIRVEVAELVILTTEKFIKDDLCCEKKEEITKKLLKK